MRILCLLLIAWLAGFASASKQITFTPPAVLLTPPSSGTIAPSTFQSPGMVFSVVVPGYSVATFGSIQQTSLCSTLTSNWVATNAGVSCSVGSVTNLNGTAIVASGFAYFTWTVTPPITTLNAAAALRDQRVTTLTTSASQIFATSSFPTAVPNCACNGLDRVTTSINSPYTYGTNITGVPGPMQCGARLTYNNGIATAIINQVGVDDGTTIATNLGKFCSALGVVGGVAGIPGSGSCRQYGVIASAAGTVQAIVNNNAGQGVAITNGALTRVDFTGGNAGLGYNTAPTVTVAHSTPEAAIPIITLNGAAQPSGLATATTNVILPTINGPYASTPIGTLGGGICVDTDAAPRCTGNSGSIIDAANQVRSGRQCSSDDFNAGNRCGAPGALGPCVTLSGTSVVSVLFPGTANTYCTYAPLVTFSASSLQFPVTAQVTATLGAGGVISSLNIVSAGSGYRLLPTVTISAPSTDQLGLLCSANPIPSLPANLAYSVPIAAGVTVDGQCRPLGRNTYTNTVCSLPAVSGGSWSPLDTYNCNVNSQFINQPGSTVTNSCGILAQNFVTAAPPNPSPSPSPTPSPTTSPSPTPTPSPTPNPTPSPTPNPTPSPFSGCVYDGVYRLENNACKGRYISYEIGSGSVCKDTSVLLQSGKQAPGLQIQWRLKATAPANKNPSASAILAIGRTTSAACKNSGVTNLAPLNSKPYLRLGGSAFRLVIKPVDPKRTCNTVTLQATNSNFEGKYLGYNSPCTNQANFLWGTRTKTANMQWNLKKVSS